MSGEGEEPLRGPDARRKHRVISDIPARIVHRGSLGGFLLGLSRAIAIVAGPESKMKDAASCASLNS